MGCFRSKFGEQLNFLNNKINEYIFNELIFVFNEQMVDSQEDMELSPILRSQNIYVLSRRSCRRHLGHVNGKLLNEKEICTQNRNGQGMCVGDMGSPLISVNREIVGIASWRGMACGNGFPDVYTRVYSHLNWIWSILIVPDDSP